MRATKTLPAPNPRRREPTSHLVLKLDGRNSRLASARPSPVATKVIALLASMGYRKTEARWLVWTALRSGELPTDRPPTTTELMRSALRAGAPATRSPSRPSSSRG